MSDRPARPVISVSSSPVRERRFRDADGVHWHVAEAHSDYDRRRGASLIFSSEGVVRRVREYPSEWFDLSDDALLALSWKV